MYHIFQNLDICKLCLPTLISNSSYLAIQTLKTWPRHFSVLLNYSLNINRKAFIAAHSFRTLNFKIMRVRSDTFCDPFIQKNWLSKMKTWPNLTRPQRYAKHPMMLKILQDCYFCKIFWMKGSQKIWLPTLVTLLHILGRKIVLLNVERRARSKCSFV